MHHWGVALAVGGFSQLQFHQEMVEADTTQLNGKYFSVK